MLKLGTEEFQTLLRRLVQERKLVRYNALLLVSFLSFLDGPPSPILAVSVIQLNVLVYLPTKVLHPKDVDEISSCFDRATVRNLRTPVVSLVTALRGQRIPDFFAVNQQDPGFETRFFGTPSKLRLALRNALNPETYSNISSALGTVTEFASLTRALHALTVCCYRFFWAR